MSGNWTSPTPKGNDPGSQTAGSSQLAKPQGPPYASSMAIVGGVPSPSVDDPVAAVLLLLFLLSAAAHMAILKINKQRQLKFVFSGMLFALCLLRGVSLAARMIWASYPDTVNAVIAASVMTQCGSVLIFIINLFFAQRVLRAYHPRLGWHRGACYAVWFLIACVLCCLVMAIIATIHSFFTLSRAARRADRAVQLFAGSYLAFLAFLPVPVVALALATHPRRGFHHVEKFGAGRWRAKVGLLVFTSLVATLGAGFRVGVNFDGRPGTDPAWFHSRACYYCFNFVTDLVVSTAYLLARFDRRFIVPDGARGPGDYSPISPVAPSATNSRTNLTAAQAQQGGGKLPLMGSEKPLVMMRQGSFSGHTIVTPFKPFTPTPSSPPDSRAMSPSPTPSPSPKPSGGSADNNNSSNNNNHSNDITNASTCCYNTDSSNTDAAHNSPATSSSLHRGKLPLHLDCKNYLTMHEQPDEKPASQAAARPQSSAAARMSRLGRSGRHIGIGGGVGVSGRKSLGVMRSVRMRINSEADAYGPDGSCYNYNNNNNNNSSSGHDNDAAADTDPLVAPPPPNPNNNNTTNSNTRQRYRYNYHPHRHFLGRSRGANISGSGSGNGSGNGNGNGSSSNVRAPAPAHLGPPILPDLDLDLELLSATLLAPWALDSWGFSPGSRRASSRRSDGGGGGGIGIGVGVGVGGNSHNHRRSGGGGNVDGAGLMMMSGGSGTSGSNEERGSGRSASGGGNRGSSSSESHNGDSTGGGTNSDTERSRSGQSSCTLHQRSERPRTM
ncbi:hypothetical protein Hte_004748 [Hypoxylon texense]